MTPHGLQEWLKVGSSVCDGVYANAYRIHGLLLQRARGVWVVDHLYDALPDKQTPREWADHIIPACELGFK
jgi:hypothetical protein